MTQEERDVIRVQCEAAKKNPYHVTHKLSEIVLDSALALLDALDAETRQADEAETMVAYYKDLYHLADRVRERTVADRDHWKARAEEVEYENKAWSIADCNTCPLQSWEACGDICASKAAMASKIAEVHARMVALERAASHDCIACVNHDAPKRIGICAKCVITPDRTHSKWQFNEALIAGGGERE